MRIKKVAVFKQYWIAYLEMLQKVDCSDIKTHYLRTRIKKYKADDALFELGKVYQGGSN